MKAAALLALLASLAMVPMTSAVTVQTPTVCAATCCETDPDCCATACPCPPLSCQAPGAAVFILPAVSPAFVFAPCCSPAAQLENDTCSARTSRPPVPPPRA